MLWPVAVWNLGLIGISSEVWPHRASETHTLIRRPASSWPHFLPTSPLPRKWQIWWLPQGGEEGKAVRASRPLAAEVTAEAQTFHSARTMWKPASRSKCSPSAAAAHVYSAGDRSEGLAGHGQCCLLKPCQTHGGVGKSAWGRATPSPKTSHWSATAGSVSAQHLHSERPPPRHKPLSSRRGFLRWTNKCSV